MTKSINIKTTLKRFKVDENDLVLIGTKKEIKLFNKHLKHKWFDVKLYNSDELPILIDINTGMTQDLKVFIQFSEIDVNKKYPKKILTVKEFVKKFTRIKNCVKKRRKALIKENLHPNTYWELVLEYTKLKKKYKKLKIQGK